MNVKPKIYNLSMTSANTEYSQQLDANTVRFTVKLRNPGVDLQMAVVSGESNTVYVTIPAGTTWTEDIKSMATGITLYFRAGTASQVAEIISWKN